MHLEGLSLFQKLQTSLNIPIPKYILALPTWGQKWIPISDMRIIKLIWITLYYWNVCSLYHTPYFSQWRPHSWYGRKNSWCLKRYYGWTSSQIELRIVQWNDGEHHETHNGNKSWCSQPFSSSFFLSKEDFSRWYFWQKEDCYSCWSMMDLCSLDAAFLNKMLLFRLTRLHINN